MVRKIFFAALFLFFLSSGYAAACTISAAAVSFSTYASNQTNPDYGTGSVTINCAASLPYSIAIDGGSNPGAYPERRMMMTGPFYISYYLYRDAAHTLTWGVPNDDLTGVGSGSDQAYTVYGKIPGGQNVTLGSYSDSLTVTVSF